MMPITIPSGVMQAKTEAMVILERVETEVSVEMREPRARPSNIWWNTITMSRFQKPESPATTVVTPITGSWC